ncbi:MAG: hypothetical protein RI513_02875 [Balneolaceae bacterium]|nr:hypothetical protein [Balneolaceae bacterium]
MTRFFTVFTLGFIAWFSMALAPQITMGQSSFNGTVTYQWVNYGSEGEPKSNDAPKLKELILAASPTETGLLALNDPDEGGVFINHEDREMYLETKKGEALRITESEYSTFVSVMEQMMGVAKTTTDIAKKVNPSNSSPLPSFDLEPTWEKTGNTKRLHGYEAEEWIVSHKNNAKTHLWMVKGVDLDWGFVAQHSASLLSTISLNGISPAFLEQNRGLVLELTVKEDEEVLFECVVKELTKNRVDEQHLASSRLENARVMSLTEFMMRSLQGE